jgi:hypothetical protein
MVNLCLLTHPPFVPPSLAGTGEIRPKLGVRSDYAAAYTQFSTLLSFPA